MKQIYLLMCSITLCFFSTNAQELPDLTTESLFYSLSSKTPEQIRFVNGLENKRIWNYQHDIIEQFPDSIRNPEKIKFVSVSYRSAEELRDAFQSLKKFPNLEYVEIKTATQFNREHVQKELILPEDLSGIEGIKFLNVSGSYDINFSRFFKHLKNLPDLEYFSFGHHLEDVVLPESFVELKKLKGLSFNGFKGLILPEAISEMPNLTSVIFYVEGFGDLSAELGKLSRLPGLTYLSLRYVDFDREKYAALGEMEELETLEFFNSEFEDLQDLFNLLPPQNQIKQLRLINLITAKSPTNYSNLQLLEELVIESRRDSDFKPSEDLFRLKNLKVLKISGSKSFNELSEEISNLENLIHLDLSINSLSSLPPQIGALTKLEWLNIRGNSLLSLPAEIGNLEDLEVLEITGNDLVHLPEEMANLRSLKEIRAEENNLKTLPQNIGNLKNLKILGLNQNQIELLPESITKLRDLKKLKLSENDLVKLPEEIGNLTGIEEMPLGGNFLEKLPESIKQLKKLKRLDVSDNDLNSLPGNLGDLEDLEELYAGNSKNRRITNYTMRGFVADTTRKPRAKNDITRLPKSLSRLTKLKRLNFSELENVESENFFNVLFELESKRFRLDLSNTGISTLPKDGWENFYVEELILGHNVIPSVPEDIINAPYLNYLSLRRSKDDRMGYSYRGEEQLNAFFEEEGFISIEDLPRTANMAEAYLQNSYNKKYSGTPGEMLELMNKAFYLDSIHTAESIRKDTYAEALMEGKAYPKAIEYFTKAIQRDTARGPVILNFIIPQFRNRAEAYLAVGDTLSAIEDLRHVSERFGAHDWGDSGLLARRINNDSLAKSLFQKGIEDYQRRIKWDAENDQVDFGYHLSLLELYIVAERTSEAIEYLAELKQLDVNPPQYKDLLHYFELILDILSGKETSEEIKSFSSSAEFSGWSFELFKNWTAQTDISSEKKQKITALTNELEN